MKMKAVMLGACFLIVSAINIHCFTPYLFIFCTRTLCSLNNKTRITEILSELENFCV